MMLPGLANPQLLCGPASLPQVVTAPILSNISLKVCFMCLAWLISYSDHLVLNRKTGIPYLSTTFGSISQKLSSRAIPSPLPRHTHVRTKEITVIFFKRSPITAGLFLFAFDLIGTIQVLDTPIKA